MAILVFWVALALLLYTLVGYPLWVWLRARYTPPRPAPPPLRRGREPKVTAIVCAADEEHTIAAKIEDLLRQDYPKDRLEILVMTDGSQDRTPDIVDRYAKEGIRHLSSQVRSGKPTLLAWAAREASGEILVLLDARQRLRSDAVRRLVEHFVDPSVGAVSGDLVLAGGEPTGIYWRYEKAIREAEARVGSLLGCTGALYAIRKALFPRKMPPQIILDDMYIPSTILLAGYRVALEPRAVALDRAAPVSREFTRKARTLAGNFQLLRLLPALLSSQNPYRFAFISHKLMRLLIPLGQAAMLVGALLAGPGYRAVAAIQLLAYLAALIGWRWQKAAHLPFLGRLFSFAYVFFTLNLATVVGLIRHLRGTQKVTWESTRLG